MELCGDSLTGDDGTWLGVMPTPAQVAAMDPDVLAANQFSRQKAAYIRDISRAVVEGELDFAQVGELPQDEAVEQLRRFKGIGRWTAEYLLMRGYGARDALPAADVGLQIYVGRAYGFGRKATEAEVREIAERVKGWRGWAAFYWWTALQSDRD